MTILMDMDGVLVDFVGGVLRHFNVNTNKLKDWKPGDYHIEKFLGLDEVDFWACLKTDFWSSLNWHPEASIFIRLLQEIDHVGHRWALCSSPGNAYGAHGKIIWLEQHMPNVYAQHQWVFTPDKSLLASGKTVLIDDSDHNCNNFRACGGQAILVPRHWNTQHMVSSYASSIVRTALIDTGVL